MIVLKYGFFYFSCLLILLLIPTRLLLPQLFFFFYSLFFYSKLLPPASLILSLFSPTVNTPLLARLPTGLYRAALYTGPVAAAASHSILPSFRCLVYKP